MSVLARCLVAVAALLIPNLPALAEDFDRPYAEGQAPAAKAKAFPSLTLIYVATGLRDSGSTENAGDATVIACTNWTSATQRIRYIIRGPLASSIKDVTYEVGASKTFTVSTHNTLFAGEDAFLDTGGVYQGSLRIFATAALITCSAFVVDADTQIPAGVSLRLVRYNAVSGTQE